MRSDPRGLQVGQRGRTVRRLMGHLRPGLREGQGAAVRRRGQPAPRRTGRRVARAATTARRLRRHGSGTADSRRAPLAPRGSRPHPLALGRHRRARGRRHPRGRERNDRRRGLVVAPGRALVVVRRPRSGTIGIARPEVRRNDGCSCLAAASGCGRTCAHHASRRGERCPTRHSIVCPGCGSNPHDPKIRGVEDSQSLSVECPPVRRVSCERTFQPRQSVPYPAVPALGLVPS